MDASTCSFWLPHSDDKGDNIYECYVCKDLSPFHSPYCPWCGRSMIRREDFRRLVTLHTRAICGFH